jgi:ABC-type uncharacterized transport system substrate-binding protein
MRRRDFLGALAAGTMGLPVRGRAQQQVAPVIGFLHSASLERRRDEVAAFNKGLGETGYVEGVNVKIEYRWAENRSDHFAELARDLVSRQVAVLAVPGNTGLVMTAKAATKTIPIVFLIGSDPVSFGLVDSLAHPGGNITGIATLSPVVVSKQLQILHELVPTAAGIALLTNQTNPYSHTETSEVQAAASTLGLQLRVANATRDTEIEEAFASLAGLKAGGLIIGTDPLFSSQLNRLVGLAARYALPTIYQYRAATVAGGLVSYGTNLIDAYRQMGLYTGQILSRQILVVIFGL